MSKSVQLTCVLALSALALGAQVATPAPTVKTTAMVGLANSQTAQFNLLNPGPSPTAGAAVCSALVAFIGADGNVIKSGVVTAAPGKSGSISLRTDTDVSIATGERREIRAQFTMPAVCTLVPTLEIYDTVSGHTLVTLGHTVTIK